MAGPIDIRRWKRRQHYELFRKYAQPFFSVTVEVDVTRLAMHCRRPGAPPFFLTSLFLMLGAVNETDAFRLRLRRRGVWRHEAVAVGPTVLKTDETFAFVRIEPSDTLGTFLRAGKAAIAAALSGKALDATKSTDDIVYHSVLPWFRFTALTNALPAGDSIPRIVFGKTTLDRRRAKMPVSVEVHHALVDGLDVARFLERFQERLEARI